METTTLTYRPLATDAEWALAARIKCDLDYAAVIGGPGSWSEPEVHALYQERWGHGEADYQLKRLREDVADGELMGFYSGEDLVAFATMRETNLLADEGPRLLIVAQIYFLRGETAPDVARRIAGIADARGIEETDLTIPEAHAEAFVAAGFQAKVRTMRRTFRPRA